jgi:hypothetical protein
MSSEERIVAGESSVRVRTARPAGSGGAGGPGRSFRTAEFATLAVVVVAILIAALIADGFSAAEAWRDVTIVAAAYIVSRGLAKLGRQSDADDGL